MEDVLTEIPPPSRFFQEELNNFTPPSPPLLSPFLLFNPKHDQPLRPYLLIVAISSSSLHIINSVSSKTLIGSVILPEISFSGNAIEPSPKDKSCNIYAINDADKVTLMVSVQCSVSAERSNVVAKLLIGGQIIPERVLILVSIQRQNFRGRLSPDETCAFKLETSAERKGQGDGCGGSSLLKGLDYFPSGSVIDGLSAALLAQCQMRNIKGTLCVSWPEYGGSVAALIKSILQKNVLHGFDLSGSDAEDKSLRSIPVNHNPFDSDLYT